VAIFDMSSFGKIDLRGPGALPLLQRLADSQMDVPVGRAVYTQFLNTKGNVEADVTITRLAADHFRLVTGSNFIGNDLGFVRMGVRPDDPPVEIRDVTEELATIGLWGPKARDVLQAVSKSDVSTQRPATSSAVIDVPENRVPSASPTSASSAGNSMRRSSARCTSGTLCTLPARSSASSREATRSWTPCGSRRAIATTAWT
jgi:hypothetical protein